MIGDQDVEAPEGRDGRRYQLLGRIGGGKIALRGATVRDAAFPHQSVGLRFGRLVVEEYFAPAATNIRTAAAPIPRDPPVIRATLLSSFRFTMRTSIARLTYRIVPWQFVDLARDGASPVSARAFPQSVRWPLVRAGTDRRPLLATGTRPL